MNRYDLIGVCEHIGYLYKTLCNTHKCLVKIKTKHLEIYDLCDCLTSVLEYVDDNVYKKLTRYNEEHKIIESKRLTMYKKCVFLDGNKCFEIIGDYDSDFLRYVYESGYTSDIHFSLDVARKGDLDCLKYILENKFPIHDDLCLGIVMYNNLECFRYILENKIPIRYKDLYSNIVRYGNLECLKCADEFGRIGDAVFIYAAYYGRLDILRYLRENGRQCPYDKSELLMYADIICRNYIINDM